MKKIIAILFVVALCFTGVFAESFDLSKIDFPAGSWVDANYDAKWEIVQDGINLYDNVSGDLIYAFRMDKIENAFYQAKSEGVQSYIEFGCPDTHRIYRFTTTNTEDLVLSIDRDWTDDPYEVTIK